MFLIGLTGGIASGKTTVSSQFMHLGCPVIDADIIAREGKLILLVDPDSDVRLLDYLGPRYVHIPYMETDSYIYTHTYDISIYNHTY